MSGDKYTTNTVKILPNQKRKVDLLSAATGKPKGEIYRDAIEEYLTKHQSEIDEAIRQ